MKKYFYRLAIVLFIYLCLRSFFFWGADDTDNHQTKTRSGLILYTDHGTGLQYIKGGSFGGIYPRLNAKGEHICIK